jgi:excisionase family DNA binding protein
MTVAQAASYLSVNRNTIYRWCEHGRLRYYELESGGGRRFKVEDLDEMLRPSGVVRLMTIRLRGAGGAPQVQPPESIGRDYFTEVDLESLRNALPSEPPPLGQEPAEPYLRRAELKNGEIEAEFGADYEVTVVELADLCIEALRRRFRWPREVDHVSTTNINILVSHRS